MLAIYKRELRAYFTSPNGYVFIALFLAMNALVFSFSTLLAETASGSALYFIVAVFQMISGTSSMTGCYFVMVMFFFMLLLPILTMKSFSEDRKSRTEQLLLTSPVSLTGMVFGKFLAAFTMFAGTLIVGDLLNFIPLYKYGTMNTARIVTCMLGILLIGAAFIAIGLFISAITENQIVAAAGTMGILMFLLLIGAVKNVIPSYPVRAVISWISIFNRFYDFTYGIVNFASLLYYLSICFAFMFLTVRLYEKRRWA